MNSMLLVVASMAVFGFVCCEPHRRNSTLAETVIEIADDARKVVVHKAENISHRITDMGEKVKEAMEELSEQDYLDDESTSTEFIGIDANGCNRGIRKQLEDKCDLEYDRVNEEAQLIENENEKTEAVCCALEDFEKCSLRAYDKAGCVTDKAAIKENLKAARLFLSVVANITCSQFRGQCAYYNSGVAEFTISYRALLFSAIPFLVLLVV